MKTIKHLMAQPFLTAVSIAAITHSTWAFATMFAGLEPHPQFEFAWWSWVIPGFLLAFSIDIGLLAMARRIRSGKRTRGILGAFGVLCLAMCYAQFVYMVSHVPEFPLSAGVRAEWRDAVQLGRDAVIWVFPALLPIALVLYAFSDNDAYGNVVTSADSIGATSQAISSTVTIEHPLPALVNNKIEVECPHCSWAGAYDSQQSVDMALRAHLRHCKYTQPIPVSANGAHKPE